MKTKLIEVGDTVLLKDKLLRQYNIPFEQRECTVLYYKDGYIELYNPNWDLPDHKLVGNFVEGIVISNNINSELQKLLDAGIELVSFTATTIDGKEIKISK